jgi:hypothetical protein
MDEESKHLLRQLVDLQQEQLELMRKNVLPLWTRIRFSLLALLALMTVAAVGTGLIALAVRSPKTVTPVARPAIPPVAAPFDPFATELSEPAAANQPR